MKKVESLPERRPHYPEEYYPWEYWISAVHKLRQQPEGLKNFQGKPNGVLIRCFLEKDTVACIPLIYKKSSVYPGKDNDETTSRMTVFVGEGDVNRVQRLVDNQQPIRFRGVVLRRRVFIESKGRDKGIVEVLATELLK